MNISFIEEVQYPCRPINVHVLFSPESQKNCKNRAEPLENSGEIA